MTAFETKQVRQIHGDDVQRRLDAADRAPLTSTQRRRVAVIVQRMTIEYVAALAKIVGSVAEKKATAREAVDEARVIMARMFPPAMQMGYMAAGLEGWQHTDDQTAMAIRIAEAELAYFAEFMRSLEADMPPSQRVGLYGGAISTMMWQGFVSTARSDAEIRWHLSVAEHCPDCIRLAQSGPYTPPSGTNPLPTVPRNGDTRCLANCKCFLTIRGTGQGFNYGVTNTIGVEVLAIAGQAVDPASQPAMAASILYDELSRQWAWLIRMDELVGGYAAEAARVKSQLDGFAAAMGHSIRSRVTIREVLAPIKQARNAGLRFVQPSDLGDDLVDLVASILVVDEVDRGVISSVGRNPPSVELDGSRQYRMDATDKAILFVED